MTYYNEQNTVTKLKIMKFIKNKFLCQFLPQLKLYFQKFNARKTGGFSSQAKHSRVTKQGQLYVWPGKSSKGHIERHGGLHVAPEPEIWHAWCRAVGLRVK